MNDKQNSDEGKEEGRGVVDLVLALSPQKDRLRVSVCCFNQGDALVAPRKPYQGDSSRPRPDPEITKYSSQQLDLQPSIFPQRRTWLMQDYLEVSLTRKRFQCNLVLAWRNLCRAI